MDSFQDKSKGEHFYECLCGVTLLGDAETYDQHIKFNCPVYAKALNILKDATNKGTS